MNSAPARHVVAAMRMLMLLVVAITSPRFGAADSFLQGGTTPPALELTVHDLFRTDAPLDHLGLLRSVHGFNAQFFEHHLRADPTNDLRVLDVGLSHAFVHRRAAAVRARALLAALGQRTADPAMKVAAAIGLAQAEADLGGRAGWHRQTSDKVLVVSLLAAACREHTNKPVVGLGETVATFVLQARGYRGYSGLDALAACAQLRAPDHPADGVFVHARWPDGTPQLEMTWKAGKRNGASRRYHDDGVLASESMWADDRRVGTERTYYPSGVLASEVTFQGGFESGRSVGYHPNGTKQWEGAYAAGRKIGTWQHWDRDGKPRAP